MKKLFKSYSEKNKFIFMSPSENFGGRDKFENQESKKQDQKPKTPAEKKKEIQDKSKKINEKGLKAAEITGANGVKKKIDSKICDKLCKSGDIDVSGVTRELNSIIDDKDGDKKNNKETPKSGETAKGSINKDNPKKPEGSKTKDKKPNKKEETVKRKEENKKQITKVIDNIKKENEKEAQKAKQEKNKEAEKAFGKNAKDLGRVSSGVGSHQVKSKEADEKNGADNNEKNPDEAGIQQRSAAMNNMEYKMGAADGNKRGDCSYAASKALGIGRKTADGFHGSSTEVKDGNAQVGDVITNATDGKKKTHSVSGAKVDATHVKWVNKVENGKVTEVNEVCSSAKGFKKTTSIGNGSLRRVNDKDSSPQKKTNK